PGGHGLGKVHHDRDEELVLRLEHPIHGARAHPGGLRDVPYRRCLEATPSEFRASNTTKVPEAIVVVRLLPTGSHLTCCLHGRRLVEFGGPALAHSNSVEEHSTFLCGKVAPDVASVEHSDPDVQHAFANPLGKQRGLDLGPEGLVPPG